MKADYASLERLFREFSGHVLAFKNTRYTLRVAGDRLILCARGARNKPSQACNKLFIEFSAVWKKPPNLQGFVAKFENRRKMFR